MRRIQALSEGGLPCNPKERLCLHPPCPFIYAAAEKSFSATGGLPPKLTDAARTLLANPDIRAFDVGNR